MSVIEGGRFDFDDGGSYVGEWCDGRAHGLGIATGPENQGEYSGEWVMGFECRGIYIWPSGNIYAGCWMKGKRHGEGVQIKGKWIFKGEFTTGFCGRYGIKESLSSASKFEGSWHLNLFDGFGVETNADGSTYSGAWSKGVRQGLGVRKSAPYYKAATHKDPTSVRAATSQNSLLSANDSDRQAFNDDVRRPNDHRSGFVLIGTSSNPEFNANKEKKPSFRKALFRKLRKQKSTGDLSSARMGGSLRSTLSSNSAASQNTNHSLPDSLPKQGLEISDPNVIETYYGQWKEDKRSGYGVAERTDGLKYEGEWYNNKKDGYGVTYFPNGTKEEGRYKENVLVQALQKRHKIFALRHSRLKDSVEEAVKNAADAASDARERAMETANQRAQTARNSAEAAENKAKEAQTLSNHSRDVAKEFAPDFLQLGVMWLKSRNNIEGKLSGNTIFSNNWNLLDNQKYLNQNYKPQQMDQLEPNLLNLSDPECLEVSGGSRRGSFRSSFRRSVEKKSTTEIQNPKIPNNSKIFISSNVRNSNQGQNATLPNNNLDCYSLEVPKLEHVEMISPVTASPMSSEPPFQRMTSTLSKGKPSQKITSNIIPVQPQFPKHKNIQYAAVHHGKTAEPQRAQMETADQYADIEQHDHHMKDIKTNNDYFEYYSKIQNQDDINDYQYEEHRKIEREVLESKLTRNEERRRSVPSIMTSRPVAPNFVPAVKYRDNAYDIVHSSEILNSTTSVYIIENGIRKRVKADQSTQPRQLPLSPKTNRLMGKRALNPINIEPEADELHPLPRNYKIESSGNPQKGLEGSLPDVSFCNKYKSKTGTLMSRQEASQLSQQRRQEILHELERQRRGEIVIRMADIKDWFKQNYAIVLILLSNCVIAVIFLHILKS